MSGEPPSKKPRVTGLASNGGQRGHRGGDQRDPWSEKFGIEDGFRYATRWMGFDMELPFEWSGGITVSDSENDGEDDSEDDAEDDSLGPMLASAWEHCDFLDSIDFLNYCVSLKDSDPLKVIEVNRAFAEKRPDVPLHLGVTEAGIPPDGVIKTRVAFEQLISRGIGDTIRVSLTVPNDRKGEEIEAGRGILADIANGRVRSVVNFNTDGLNIISCPSCSRVENEAFVQLAEDVKSMTAYAQEHSVTIAVMGCRVNGPGETDDADLGLWCGPNYVNLKKGPRELGQFGYDVILSKLKTELDLVISEKQQD